MKAGDDVHRVITEAKEQAVREAAQPHAPHVRQHHWKLQRVSGDPLHLTVRFGAELRAKAGGFPFISVLRFSGFSLCSGLEENLKCHGTRRASSALS
jgi:hypothetical protein